MKYFPSIFLSIVFLAGCKEEKQKADVPAANFFPVTSYIGGELARMDTSLASFYKIETKNDRTDTAAISNKDLKQYAKDFLTLPDITQDPLKNDYEITHLYDDLLEAFVFTFTTKEDHPVRKEIVLLEPVLNEQGKNDIKSIFIDLWEKQNGYLVRKNMLWEAGKSFQITTVNEEGGKQETSKVQVIWNGLESTNKLE